MRCKIFVCFGLFGLLIFFCTLTFESAEFCIAVPKRAAGLCARCVVRKGRTKREPKSSRNNTTRILEK